MTLRQFDMVRTIITDHRNRISFKQALTFNQLIFGSLCQRELIAWNSDRDHFYVTDNGKQLYQLLAAWQPFRSNFDAPAGIRVERAIGRRRLHRVA